MTAEEDELWETHAQWWQDGFTQGADPEYEEQILPLATQLLDGYQNVLDIGTGEGQIARLAVGGGAQRVVGFDPSHNQIVEAHARAGGPAYTRAAAAAMPFASQSFDAAIACLVFEHIADVDEAIREVARVVKPGGRFVFMLNHPLLQTPGSGWIDDHIMDPPEQYWRIGPYLIESHVVEQVMQGVFVPFIHRPIGRYINALLDAGFDLRRLLEPTPPPGFLAKAPEYLEASSIPRLLVLVLERRLEGGAAS